MKKPLTLEEKKAYGTIKNRDWYEKNTVLFLDQELYPDKLLTNSFFILTEKEILELDALTKKRIKQYNKNINPKGWTGFTEK